MSKPKPEKLTATTTSEKSRQQKPLVQIEVELTEAQLEAIGVSLCAERNRWWKAWCKLTHN